MTGPVPRLLLPDRDADSAPFWDAALLGELVVQRCDGCGVQRFPPRPMCASCRSLLSTWRPVSGRGQVWSWVVVHPPVLPAYAPYAPFPVAVVELAEAPDLRMVGNVVTGRDAVINSVDPTRLRIGMPVRVVFQQVAADVALPRWVPDDEGPRPA